VATEAAAPTDTRMPTATTAGPATDTPGGVVTGTQEVTGTPGLPPTGLVDPSRVSVLLDMPVQDQAGETMGNVDDLVLNLRTMCLDYLVLSPDVALALENDRVAIPWQAVTISGDATEDMDAQALVLNVSSDALQNAPGFATDGEPDLTDEDWDLDLRDFWTTNITGTGTITATDTMTGTTGMNCGLGQQGQGGTDTGSQGPNRSVLTNQILGVDVQDADGNSLGEIEDAIVDVESGAIRYFLVAAGGFLGIGEKLIPVPLGAFSYAAEEDDFLTLNVDADVLTNAPTFDADGLPDARTPGWDTDISSYWDQQDFQGGTGGDTGGADAQGTATPTTAP
jgi:sporulation protein YlmC with PRC-barrel domain